MDNTTFIIAAASTLLISHQDEIKSPLKELNDVYVKMTQICQALPKQPFYDQITSHEEWNQLSLKALNICNTIKSQKLNSKEKEEFRILTQLLRDQTDEIKGVI